ncbi:MAG: ABC transporter permease [Candidatus Dormibacteraeota bacterium]|nr:ABC transporter permease [Candidatus Dormibacteraeota bacterium]
MSEAQAAGLTLAEVDARVIRRPARSYWRESWDRLLENRLGVIAGLFIVVLAAVALGAPLLSAYVTHFDPARQDLTHNFLPPGRPHLLGTDELGRDTLTRLIFGARISLGIGFLTVALLLLVGGTVGLLAGYYGGWLDTVLMRLVDVVLSFPAVFLYILLAILFRPSTLTLSLIIASVAWANVARLVRGQVLALREQDYVLATRSLGAGDVRLMLRHLVPNALPVIVVAASISVGQIILIEAALDFLGLGIQPPTASWGNMLTNAQVYFVHSAWLVYFPGLAIFLTVLAANVFGNAVRDAFDPRLVRL